jgi:hypothetical protein
VWRSPPAQGAAPLACRAMPHLDLDPDDLAALAARVHGAAGLLDGITAGRGGPDGAAEAAGEPVLAAAIRELFDAWTPTHRDLRDALDQVAAGLDRAADLYGTAELTTAEGIARSIGPATDGTP